MSGSSSVSVTALLKKTEHYDKDERYMATSDLCEVLKRSGSVPSDSYHTMDAATERKICTAVLRLLHDKSNDVQAIAVKTLGILLTTVHEEQVLEIADSLADRVLDRDKSELRDVYAIGLRTLCKTVPTDMGDKVSQKLVGRLLEGIQSDVEEIVLACLDVLTDLLGRFGASSVHVTRQHEPILQLCLTQLSSDSHVVRKRAGNTIGCLSVVLSDTLLVRMVESLLNQIDMAEGVGKSGRRRTRLAQKQAAAAQKAANKAGDTRALIRTMCTVSGAVGHRLGQAQIDRIVPIFLRFCDPDDAITGDDDMDDDDEMMEDAEQDEAAIALANELRESCFTGFESFISRCPTEVEPHLDQIVQAALAYMSYDPNYQYGDDDLEDVDEDYDEDDYDDEGDDEDEDDDDDDDSWKVRRAAIRALAAVVNTKQHDPSMLWTKSFNVRKGKSTTVANAMMSRFKEREENCRVDVIDCTTNLIKVTVNAAEEGGVRFASPDDMDTEGVVIDLSTSYRPTLIKSCEKLITKKGGERSKAAALALLSTLCLVPGGVGGEEEIESVFTHIQHFVGNHATDSALHRDTSSKTLKLDALRLVDVMLSCDKHDPVCIKRNIYKTLLPDLCLSVKEHWYKLIAEALRVLAEVPRYFLTGYDGTEDPMARKQEAEMVATSIYEAIEPLLSAHDVDQEIKECALATCASLLSSLHGNLTKQQMDRLLSLILERLRNETTRISAIKTLSTVASSSGVDSMEDVEKIDLSLILGDSVSEMSLFLKQQSRSLKQSSLEALDVVVTNHGSEDLTLGDGQLFSTVLQESADLVVDSDLHLSHLGLRVSISILKVCPACGPAVKEHVLTPSLVLSTSPLLQDNALDSLLAFLEQMVVSEAIDFKELLALLRKSAESEEKLNKLALSSLAKGIAVTTAATTVENREEVIADILSSLEGVDAAMEDDASMRQMILSLRASGDLGRVFDLTSMDGVAQRFQAIYLDSFDSSSEEIKQAAAYALGRAAMGAQAVLLPAIVDALERNNQKKQYLLLSALREFIQCHLQSGGDAIVPSVPVILPHLINHCVDEEESVRTMVAECMGALTCLQPAGMLVTLRDLIAEHSEIVAPDGHVAEDDETSKTNALACWTALTAIKLAIAGKASSSDLSMFMPDFLKLLEVEELGVRNAALLMVYSSVHHMPQLVSGLMSELIIPRLQEVSNLQLKKVVDLGPFKHTVDDALPLRKSALSIYATCLENLPGSLDIAAFMPVLAKALGDAEDVQLQAHQIVISMCSHHSPSYLEAAVDSFVEPLEKTVNKKTSQKTGTELERANEWIKSGLRAMIALSKLEGVMNSPKFSDFFDRTRKNAKFRALLDALDAEY